VIKKLLILSILGLIGLVCGYFYVDRKVQLRLESRKIDQIPAVYSDMLVLTPASRLSKDLLRAELLSRRYREVPSAATPGEFSSQGPIFNIVAREFRSPDGSIVPSQKLHYDSDTGLISDFEQHPKNNLVLEPGIVSYLGDTEQRASSFKSLKEIPPIVSKAVIAIEDERFAKHHGIDLYGIARAMLKNLAALRIVEGGSTLTQQLAKNILFTPERTIGRKVSEALAAISLENHLSKQQILEMYLNEVYLGQEGAVAIHGVAEASKTFFGHELKDVSIAEAAMLAGMIKAPSFYSPRKHFRRCLERSLIVLDKLRELDLITEAELLNAKAHKPSVVKKTLHERNASHYVLALTNELNGFFNVEAASLSGLSVFTGFDLNMQHCAEQAVASGLERIEKDHPKLKRSKKALEAGLVAIEPHSGKIRSWVGSRDYGKNQFDHVIQAKRQIGSTVKAFLYLTALDGNLNNYKVATPLTILSDEPMQIDVSARKIWMPENYDHKYRGDVTLRYALENSLNVPAAYVGQKIGIQNVANTLRRFHVSENPPAVPSLALGAADTTLLQLTSGYAAIANGGQYVAPRLFVSALDTNGNTLATSQIIEERLADENAVFVLTNLLEGVVERGTGKAVRALGFTREAAGKTGTSNEARDAWFIGFTPTLVAGVWVGFDDNTEIGVTGGAAAAPIWTNFMKCSEPFYADDSFIAPPGVIFENVDVESGELATTNCPSDSVVKEVFVRGTEPRLQCHLHNSYPEDTGRPNEARDNSRELEPDQGRPRHRKFWEMIFGE